MRNRTGFLIGAIVVLILLAAGGTIGTMALTRSGFMGSRSPYGMMNRQWGYQQMPSGQPTPGGMMGGYQMTPGSMMGGSSQQTPGTQGTPETGVTQVAIQNFAYQPANAQIRVGTTMTWTNQDSVPHSVSFKQQTMRGSGMLSQGQSFSYTFTMPGRYQYFCLVHPNMIATITVVS